jgi:Ankyrin repeat
MPPTACAQNPLFADAVEGLLQGDFSRLEPPFAEGSAEDGNCSRIREWYEKGCFRNQPKALVEAFTCACFLAATGVAEFLLNEGVDPSGGDATGVGAFHWAANRGQLETVRLLIERKVPLETKNMYGGAVLGMAVWSAMHEPRPDHVAIIGTLADAGALLDTTGFPTGVKRIDDVLRSRDARSDLRKE